MADDTLRIVAKVDDQFTGPLAKLKGELKSVGDETAKHGALWKKDWAAARQEVDKFRGVLGGFTPILSSIGMGGFGAALSIGGIATALKAFSGQTRDLSQMGRQIGMTVDQLRTLGALGERFGVSADAMRGAIDQFAHNMVDLRQRWGQVYGELRSMNLGNLAEELVNAPNMEAAVEAAMKALQNIPDSMKAARVSTLIFGTPDMATISRSITGKISDALKQTQTEIGHLDKETEEASRRFEEHLSRIGRAAEKLKLKVLGPLLKGTADLLDDAEKNGLSGNDTEQAFRKQLSPFGGSGPSARESLEGRRAQVEQQLRLLESGPRDKDYQRKHDRMVEELKRVADELQKVREQGGASYSPTGYGGPSGGGGGSLIQKAAWGGLGGSDGMSGMRSRYPVPDYGSGGGSGGGGGASDPDTPTPRGNGLGTRGGARTGDMMRYAMDQLRREGVPEAHLRQAAAHLVGQARMESGLDPNKVHDGGTGYGIYGARDPSPGRGRKTAMLRWLKAHGYAPNSAEGQMRYMAHEAMTDRTYRATRGVLMGQGSGNVDRDTDTITENFESPKIINRRSGAVRDAMRTGPSAEPGQTGPTAADENGDFPNGAPRALKPLSMADDPSVPGKVIGRRRGVGDALMDRFYGKGAAGGGPAMQMPGEAGPSGKGRLDIHLHGFPNGTQTSASLDGLFDDHRVSKGRSQMDLDRA